jgi:rhamnosyltransferase subunit B
MSRIVLTTIGSLGDLHPKIALALELRQRGHDVVFATHQEYQAKIAALGFEFHRMRPDNTALNDPQEMARMMDLQKGTEYVINQWVLPSLRDTYSDLISCAKDADLIIAGEGVFAARMVAEKIGIPWVSTALQPLAFLSRHEPVVLPVLPFLAKFQWLGTIAQRGIFQLAKVMTRSWSTPIHDLRRELGLPPLQGNPLIDDKYSPYLVLAMFSSVFAKPQPDWPTSTVQTGFTFYDDRQGAAELSPELTQFLADGSAPIVFTLGSAAVMDPGRFYEESIEAATLSNHRAVLLIGKNAPPKPLPTGIIAVNYAPYSQVFAQARAIVHQGGIGTTAQALQSGRPMLVMPYSHDQPDNAARVERLGTGRKIARKQYSAARVAQHLRELLEKPSYTEKAAAIGQVMRSENGAGMACDAIAQHLSRH